ncbi:tetratricopeptide repeat protein [Compostibacter hankyongensis]|uniref:Tetratricopeptide repeat protein n=1 Tax=Compostibacter hankyongensis TaxID=1007089 RepID=A0ABP8FI98_9BACT
MLRCRTIIVLGCVGALVVAGSCRTTRTAGQDNAVSAVSTGADDWLSPAQRVDSLFFEAKKTAFAGEPKAAIRLFEDVLRLQPENAAAKYELSRIFGQLHEPAAALPYARSAYQADSSNRWFTIAYADALVGDKQPDKAADLFENLYRRHPHEDQYLLNEAILRGNAGRHTEALQLLDRLEEQQGVNEELVYQKQALFLKMGNTEAAAAEIRKLIRLYPEEGRYYALLAQVYDMKDLPDKAISVYDTLLKRDPGNPRALVAIALQYKKKGAERTYEKYMGKAFANPGYAIDDKIAFVYPFLKYIEVDSTKKDEALKLCRMIVHAHPGEARAYALYGDMWYQAGQPDSALVQYRRSMALDDSRFELWQQLMLIYAAKEQNDSLLRISGVVTRRFPDELLGWYFSGVVKVAEQQYPEGVRDLQQALTVPIKNDKIRNRIYISLAEAYNAMQRYADSDSCFEKALRLKPDDDLTLNNYSYYLSERGEQLKKAARMSALSLKLSPGNDNYEDTYARILFKLRRYREAKQWMERVLSRPGARAHPGYLEHYGDILYKLRQVDRAVKYWQLAREKGAGSAVLERKIAARKLP